jgi:hypothetical protein
MATTAETNDFGFDEPMGLSMIEDGYEFVLKIQERVSRRTVVLQEILQRFGTNTGRVIRMGSVAGGLTGSTAMQEKRKLLHSVEWLKDKILHEQLQRPGSANREALFRKAADEAAVMAFGTDFPLLVLPGLMQERFWEVKREV